MASGVVKYLAGFLLLLNLCMYVIVGAIAGWALNKALDHTYSTGLGRTLPLKFSPVYFPIGNEATGFMIIFALIAAAVGTASCLSGLHHLRVWTAQSLASSTASSMTAWALTLLAMGLVCKEIHIGGRSTKLASSSPGLDCTELGFQYGILHDSLGSHTTGNGVGMQGYPYWRPKHKVDNVGNVSYYSVWNKTLLHLTYSH